MKHKLWLSLLLLALTLCPAALASTTWYVDGVHGSDNNNCKSAQNACKTIGHGISLAHSGDSILVAAATYTENLTIGMSLKLIGSGAQTTIIDGGAKGTVVSIASSNSHVTLSKLTIQNGNAAYGGGIYNNFGGMLNINDSTITGNIATNATRFVCWGGGVLNGGTLSINHTTISGNSAKLGGGICNRGTATISNSTISGNNAFSGYNGGLAVGGGIYNLGRLTINNSTLRGNSATTIGDVDCGLAYGGGISGSKTLTINNSTLSGNYAKNCAGIGFGGGISGNVTLQNTVVASSPYGGNCYGTVTSDGYNLSSDNTCNFNSTGDLNNIDPKLGQLGNHGGPTQTIPLLSGSPAIDAGNPNGCTDGQGHLLKTDQRGQPRPDREDAGGCDMGAFERQKD
jgi:hypothetical protein